MNRRVLLSITLLLSLVVMACEPKSGPPKIATTDSIPDRPKPQHAADEQQVGAALNTILELAQKGACEELAEHLVYHDTLSPGAWQRSIDYAVESEQIAADKECAKLQVIVMGMASHTLTEFATVTEDEGEWLIWEVLFEREDNTTERKKFGFLRVGEQYLLGDID
ncbi:MAG: hypothetical protein U0176_25900 [Bacteroidia bacterium]